MALAVIGKCAEWLRYTIPGAVFFNTANITDIKNRSFDIVYCSSLSNNDHDLLIRNLKTLNTVDKMILFSTTQVFGDRQVSADESVLPLPDTENGRVYLELENFLLTEFPRVSIVRLPMLFGFGIADNIVHDYLKHDIEPTLETAQLYFSDWLEYDLPDIIRRSRSVVHLVSQPLATSEWLGGKTGPPGLSVRTRWRDSGWYRSRKAVLSAIRGYMFDMTRSNVQLSDYFGERLESKYGMATRQASPSKIFGRNYVLDRLIDFSKFKSQKIYSLCNIFPEGIRYNLFSRSTPTLLHIHQMIDIAVLIGAKVLIIDDPEVLRAPTDVSPADSLARAIEFFRDVAKSIGDRDCAVCIESCPKSNFLTTTGETAKFVSQVDRPKIALALNTAKSEEASENIHYVFEKYISLARHVQFVAPANCSFPFLRFLLDKKSYNGKISLVCGSDHQSRFVRQVMTTMNVRISGAGWFGCHIVDAVLDKGYNLRLEDPLGVLSKAVGFSECRLDAGYAFARSFSTRMMLYRQFNRFLDAYKGCCSRVPLNIYAISNESCIDFDTYHAIMSSAGLRPSRAEAEDLRNCESAVIVDERFIDMDIARETLTHKVCPYLFSDASPKAADFRIDCNGWTKRVKCVSLVYQARASLSLRAISVVDGPFFSLFPYKPDMHLYTITHRGSLMQLRDDEVMTDQWLASKRHKLELLVFYYMPNFHQDFVYHGFFVSEQCPEVNNTGSMEFTAYRKGNKLGVDGGKITGMFLLEDWISEFL